MKDANAAKAWKAVWHMAEAPEDVVPFLRGRLKPILPAPAEVTRLLLADLEGDAFAKREAASKRLLELGVLGESALRARLGENPPLESKLRIEKLLKTIVETPQPLSADLLRDLRAVAVLARIPTAEARGVLETLARGADSARLTEAANAALGR